MITEEKLGQIDRSLQRLFALPITRMTLRELQDAIKNAMDGKIEASTAIYNSLLTGEMDVSLKKNGASKQMQKLIDSFSASTRIAHEVSELGEFMNSFSCDFLQQGNQLFFVNRMRRIDGSEYHFCSAPETNIRLARMFINRLIDLKNATSGSLKLDSNIKKELETIKKDIQELLA